MLKTLKELRKEKGMTQTDLAEILNVSQAIVSCYERKKRYPSRKVIKKLSNVFSLNAEQIREYFDI